jgi:hypothetical protein
MGGCPGKSERAQAREGACGLMVEIGDSRKDFKMRFRDFWLRVNYYYPPDDGFLAANGKKLLHD